jgi:RelB antitoxin
LREEPGDKERYHHTAAMQLRDMEHAERCRPRHDLAAVRLNKSFAKVPPGDTALWKGLRRSSPIRLLLARIAAEKALPFEIKVPNAETRAASDCCLAAADPGRILPSDGEAQ